MSRSSKNPKAGIYQILHTETEQRYIGQSLDIERRFKEHHADLSSQKHYNYKLQKLWNSYGPNAFVFQVLELAPDEIKDHDRQQWLLDKETAYWEGYSSTRLNNIQPEFVMTGDMRKAYKKKKEEERKSEAKAITSKINQVNHLLKKAGEMPRPPLEPVNQAKREFRDLADEHWKATGWRVLIYWNRWLVNRENLSDELKHAKTKYEELWEAYSEKDILRRQLLDLRKKLYNSYPGRRKPTVDELLKEYKFRKRRRR